MDIMLYGGEKVICDGMGQAPCRYSDIHHHPVQQKGPQHSKSFGQQCEPRWKSAQSQKWYVGLLYACPIVG